MPLAAQGISATCALTKAGHAMSSQILAAAALGALRILTIRE
jgi:hypothetical protein